jgi:hypothetical protein
VLVFAIMIRLFESDRIMASGTFQRTPKGFYQHRRQAFRHSRSSHELSVASLVSALLLGPLPRTRLKREAHSTAYTDATHLIRDFILDATSLSATKRSLSEAT